jgi:hypothetical protein
LTSLLGESVFYEEFIDQPFNTLLKMKQIFSFTGLLIMAILGMALAIPADVLFSAAEPGVVMATMAVLTSPQRANYNRFNNHLFDAGLVAAGSTPLITQKDLRLEVALSAQKSSYRLDTREGNSNVDGPLEIKLNQNDIFMVTAIGVALRKVNGDVHKPLQTFPDPKYFAGAGEAQALEAIYNGTMSVTTDSLKRVDEMALHHCRFVPGVQNDTTDNILPGYGPTLEERGYFTINPNIILDGSKSNIIDVILGAGSLAAIAGPGPDVNHLVVLLHGFLFSGQVAGPEGCLV